MKKLLATVVLTAALMGAVIVIGIVRFDGAAFAAAFESGLAVATGRTWTVNGDVRFVPGIVPALTVAGLSTPNSPWASEADYLSVGSVRFETDWLSVISGEPAVGAVQITDVVVNLETDGDGGNNWRTPAAAPARPPAGTTAFRSLRRVVVERTLVRFRSGWAEAESTYPIASIVVEHAGADVPLALSIDAEVKGQPLSIGGQLGSPALMFGGQAFAIALNGRYSGRESNADIAIDGRIGRLAGLEDLNLKFTLKADSLNEVGSISGFELPRDTPVAITAAIVNPGAGPELADYVLRIGQAIIRPQD